MAADTDSECSSVANLSDFNNFEDLQVPEFVDIEEVRHVEYVGPYMHEPDAEECVEIVPVVEGQEWRLEGERLNEW